MIKKHCLSFKYCSRLYDNRALKSDKRQAASTKTIRFLVEISLILDWFQNFYCTIFSTNLLYVRTFICNKLLSLDHLSFHTSLNIISLKKQLQSVSTFYFKSKNIEISKETLTLGKVPT